MTDFALALDKLRDYLAREAGVATIVTSEGSLVSVPPGVTLKTLHELTAHFQPTPLRPQGTVQVKDIEALIAYVNAFRGPGTFVFADPDQAPPLFTAVLNHHHPHGEGGSYGDPHWGDWRCAFALKLSPEWQAWRAASGQAMRQGDFAEFLEERLAEVAPPPSADESGPLAELGRMLGLAFASREELVQLSRTFRIKAELNVASARLLSSGEGELLWKEEHRDEQGKPVRVPGLFVIAIPVFERGPVYKLVVRLRYRVAGQTVSFTPLLHRPELAYDHAFAEAVERVERETSVPTLLAAAPVSGAKAAP